MRVEVEVSAERRQVLTAEPNELHTVLLCCPIGFGMNGMNRAVSVITGFLCDRLLYATPLNYPGDGQNGVVERLGDPEGSVSACFSRLASRHSRTDSCGPSCKAGSGRRCSRPAAWEACRSSAYRSADVLGGVAALYDAEDMSCHAILIAIGNSPRKRCANGARWRAIFSSTRRSSCRLAST